MNFLTDKHPEIFYITDVLFVVTTGIGRYWSTGTGTGGKIEYRTGTGTGQNFDRYRYFFVVFKIVPFIKKTFSFRTAYQHNIPQKSKKRKIFTVGDPFKIFAAAFSGKNGKNFLKNTVFNFKFLKFSHFFKFFGAMRRFSSKLIV